MTKAFNYMERGGELIAQGVPDEEAVPYSRKRRRRRTLPYSMTVHGSVFLMI